MFSFLGFIFIFILVILLFGLSIIGTIIRTIFGRGRKADNSRQQQNNTRTQNTTNDMHTDTRPAERKKIFDKDDGEYVDYEEVE